MLGVSSSTSALWTPYRLHSGQLIKNKNRKSHYMYWSFLCARRYVNCAIAIVIFDRSPLKEGRWRAKLVLDRDGGVGIVTMGILVHEGACLLICAYESYLPKQATHSVNFVNRCYP